MGTTAFLIADFLQIDYAEVAVAAILPAVVYYLALFVMVDRYAQRNGLFGLARKDLPKLRPTLLRGWIFILPLGMLLCCSGSATIPENRLSTRPAYCCC